MIYLSVIPENVFGSLTAWCSGSWFRLIFFFALEKNPKYRFFRGPGGARTAWISCSTSFPWAQKITALRNKAMEGSYSFNRTPFSHGWKTAVFRKGYGNRTRKFFWRTAFLLPFLLPVFLKGSDRESALNAVLVPPLIANSWSAWFFLIEDSAVPFVAVGKPSGTPIAVLASADRCTNHSQEMLEQSSAAQVNFQ